MMYGVQAAAGLARLLGDPLRLAILRALIRQDATVSELLASTGTTQSNLSNHLRLLRENDLVRGERQGRQIVYRIATPAITELVEALLLAVPGEDDGKTPAGALAQARTCYDHLAGKLGVSLLDGLVSRRALQRPEDGWTDLQFGPAAANTFGKIGIDLEAEIRRGSRRRIAYSCPDWSENGRSHIGGLIGAVLCRHCRTMGWVRINERTRAVELTGAGESGLAWLLH